MSLWPKLPVEHDVQLATAPAVAPYIQTGSPGADMIQWYQPHMPIIIFALCLVFTPIYIWNYSRKAARPQPWRRQAIVSSLAFIVWTYAIQGSLFTTGQYLPFHLFSANAQSGNAFDGILAAFFLVVFSLCSGIIEPEPVAATAAPGPRL